MSSIKNVDGSVNSLLTDSNVDSQLQSSLGSLNIKIWTISEWLNHTRQWLESHYSYFWLKGEISAFTQASSGHCYFVLKEGSSQLRCVLFRMHAQRVGFKLANGLQVEAWVQATIYEERGDLQLKVERIRAVGQGDLWQQFLRLKQTLETRGWFAAERKKALPAYPRIVGIVTSLQAAALRDVIAVFKKRAPSVTLIIYPAAVQGEFAGTDLARAVRVACERAEVEVLLLCRGGGSLEDLAAFNEECLAQALFEATLPVISGVGHETDFTIADFVADRRAPTPTAAAVLAVPDEDELHVQLVRMMRRLVSHAQHRFDREQLRLDHLSQQLKNPRDRLKQDQQRLDYLKQRWQRLRIVITKSLRHTLVLQHQRLSSGIDLPQPQFLQQRMQRLTTSFSHVLSTLQNRSAHLETRYSLAHPKAPLAKGYAMVSTLPPEEKIISSVKGLAAGQVLQVSLADGAMHVVVRSITHGDSKE